MPTSVSLPRLYRYLSHLGQATLKIKGASFQLHRVTDESERRSLLQALEKVENRLTILDLEKVDKKRVKILLTRVIEIKSLLAK